ncbi:2-oxo-3-hexenedioate decarboxylase [Hoeflea halophila]|uniref:2-oxo-3-hexenedioate decarboxylase n=1 Tax=Hoeflea halophila TaxID=714899 RepID=A0A286HKW1_9HYPH|nr:fumarylacetoacetate hydrolase family protein [Hoeflea halophila]SOE08453.1 2-oxo-3-hexenedioate decarboxylase [Hoeflea halophila]
MSDLTEESRALEILNARRDRRQIARGNSGDLTMDAAYRINRRIRDLRTKAGERVIGRKIGFTNRTIWDEYNVHAPIWGYMYDTTFRDVAPKETCFSLAPFCEPRIEPEIAFCFARPPLAGTSEEDLLASIAWYAHGFEIVDSLYKDWKFEAADTVAAFGLHGAYLCGPRRYLKDEDPTRLLEALQSFQIELARDGETIDIGQSSNVLGSPLTALRHAIEVIAKDPDADPVGAGEIITTGTVTRAFPIKPGETWSTRVTGLALDNMRATFT